MLLQIDRKEKCTINDDKFESDFEINSISDLQRASWQPLELNRQTGLKRKHTFTENTVIMNEFAGNLVKYFCKIIV